MSEISRVYRKKTILFLLVLCVVNFALFLFSAAPDKEITLSGDALTSYISSYPGFLARTAESGHTLASLNMYKKGYAYEVLKKSTAAYEKLEGIYPRGGDNSGIVLLLQYRITDLFLLAFLIILTADFMAERKKGLAGMVRSTLKGRGNLYLQRIVILAFSALLGALLLYGGNYLGMLFTFGKTDMSRCIQSLPEFMKCPYNLTIRDYLLSSVFLKALGCFAVAGVFLMLISLLGTVSAYVGMAVLVVLEVVLNLLVIPVSTVNFLRYLNFYTIISCEECFTDFCFINVFGKAVPAVSGILIFLAIFILLLAAAGLYIHGKLYVSNKQIGERIMNKIAVFREKTAIQHSLIGWEGYKLFVKQGALLIIAVVFVVHFYMSTKYSYSYLVDAYEQLMYLKYEGDITEETYGKAQREMDMLLERIERYSRLYNELQLEKPVDENKLMLLASSLREVENMRDGLQPVLNDMQGGIEYLRKTGRTVQLVQPFTYEMLFEKDGKTTDRASLLILIGIIGAVSGIFAFDTENHMGDSIHTAYRGRKQTVAVKLLMMFVACAVISVSLHMIQIRQIGEYMGFNNLDAPVQSLKIMRGFGPYVSILGYFVLLFGVRTLVAYAIGLLCGLVSRFSRDTITALGISAFLFVIPTVFAEIIPWANNFSAIRLLGASYFRGKEFVLEAEEEEEQVSEWVYVPEYRDFEIGNNVYGMKQVGDFLYYNISDANADSEQQKAVQLGRYSILDGSTDTITLQVEGQNRQYMQCFSFAEDGSIFAVLYFWEQDEETENYNSWYSLAKCDPTGELIFQVDLSDIMAQEKTDYIGYVAIDGENRIYLVSESKVLLLDENGNYAGKVDLSGMMGNRINSIGRGKDGKVYASYGSFSFNLVEIDYERRKAGTVHENFPSSGGDLNWGAEKDFLVNDSTSAYEYDCETDTSEELFRWLDCDVDGTTVMSLGKLSDGRILAVVYDWNDWDNANSSLVLLTKKHISEVAQKETVVLATMMSSSDLKAAVVKFNRASDKYRVVVKEYWSSYDWSSSGSWGDAMDRLNMDLLSDKAPDLIDLSSVNGENLYKSGAIENLVPYLEASPVLAREDFVDHVLDGYTYGDAVVGLPRRVSIVTLIGRTSDVGPNMGWTQKDMTALADAHPDVDIINYASKRSILFSALRYHSSLFVNWDTGECHFDSPEFIRILEFANRFADTVAYDSEVSLPVKIQKGEILLTDESISSFKDLQMYKAMYGGDVTFIGYPTPDGSPGCDMVLNDTYALSTNSKKKEAAWAFLESYLTSEEADRWTFGFPTLKWQLENQLEEEVKVEYLTDENGEILRDDDGEPIIKNRLSSVSYSDGWSYQYHVVTREEAEQVMELIRAAKPNLSSDSQISSIVSEEADYYFKGAKTPEDAAAIIQRRVQLYVNENR